MRWGAKLLVPAAVLGLGLTACGSQTSPAGGGRATASAAGTTDFPGYRPTAEDLADAPRRTVEIPADQLDLPVVEARLPPKGRVATSAEAADYRSALSELDEHVTGRVVSRFSGDTSVSATDYDFLHDAERDSETNASGTLRLIHLAIGDQIYLPASKVNAIYSPYDDDVAYPDTAWFDNAGRSSGFRDLGEALFLDPDATQCGGRCPLTVLPTVDGVQHFLVYVFDVSDVAIVDGHITSYDEFDPFGDGGENVVHNVIEPLPSDEPILAPGRSLIIGEAQQRVADARASAVANTPPSPTTSCSPPNSSGEGFCVRSAPFVVPTR